jgi:hypothetical protein
MKKQLVLAAALFVSTLAMAQVTPSFGIRAGLSSANLHGDAIGNLNNILNYTNGMISTGSRTGLFAGAYTSIPLSENISVEPALYYTQKGTALKGDLAVKAVQFLGVNAHAHLTEHYIDMPVLLKGTINGFQVFAGPQISYLANANFKTTAGILGINLLNKNIDVTDQMNRWDAGVTAGIGYQFANGVNITAAYDHGLSRVDANKSLNSYNRSIKVGVGFRF